MNEKPISILKEGYGFWEDYIEHLREDRNIETLWPPQYQSLENGALEEDNFLLISSPGSGKTLVAELVMVYEFLKKRSSSVYLVPYKSLAEEKYTDFEDQLGEFGLTIKSSYGEGRKEPAELFSADISILTYEKFDYYLRNFPSTLTDIGSIIVDEFHKVSDPTRGPNLEITIARILSSYPNVRILGLSATVQNSEELGEWLGANICHVENWHKNKLIEGICTKDSNLIKFYAEEDQKEEDLEEFVDDFKANAIINFIKEADNQSLIFASTRSLAEESATTLAEFIDSREKSLDFNLEQNFLDQLAEEVANLPGTHGKTRKRGREEVAHEKTRKYTKKKEKVMADRSLSAMTLSCHFVCFVGSPLFLEFIDALW